MIADILLKVAGQFQDEEHDYFPRCSLAGPERCLRQMVFWGLKIERDPLPGRTLHVFNDGNWHAELTLDWIRKSAFSVHSEEMEVKIVPLDGVAFDHILTGHIDGIVTDIMGADRLLEHKAINHFTFMRYWNKEELPLDYLTQCCLYLRGLHVDNPDLKEVLLLVKNKNTAAYLEYLIEYDYHADAAFVVNKINSNGEKVDIKESIEHICQEALEKFAKVEECIKTKTLPKRQYDISHWRCEYCGWIKKCWEGWEAEIEAMTVTDMLPEEIATMVKYRQEVGGQKGDITKEYDDMTDKIKIALKDKGIKEGKAGGYMVRLLLKHRVEKVQEAKTWDQLDIRKMKEG